MTIEFDGAAIGLDQAGDHVEHRGLAGAVRAEQTDGLAAANIDADTTHHLAGAKTFFHAMHSQIARPPQQLRAASAVGLRTGLGTGLGIGPGGLVRRLGAGARLFGTWRMIDSRRRWPGQIKAGLRPIARDRRRIADRLRQHVAEGIAKRGDVLARARKTSPAALGGASTEHAENIHHPRFA